jgi:hypothetical protein
MNLETSQHNTLNRTAVRRRVSSYVAIVQSLLSIFIGQLRNLAGLAGPAAAELWQQRVERDELI